MRALKYIVVFAAVAGIFCGAPEQERPRADGGYGPLPAATFEELTQAEVDALVKVLPDVTAALGAAGYAPEFEEDGGIADLIYRSATGMKEVPGVADALKKCDMDWEAFQTTMFKVMSAAAAIGRDMTAAMVDSLGLEGEELEMVKAELARGKEFCDRVPVANRNMVTANREKLGPLAGGQ